MTQSATNASSMPTLDELMQSLGFELWQEVLNKCVLPLVNLVSIGSCSLSAWIFYKKRTSHFSDPIFFYYRLLCLLYMSMSFLNILFGFCYSPRFYNFDLTYMSAVYNVCYLYLTNFLFHYCSVLELCILLTRMKLYDPFIRKQFFLSPQLYSFIFFIVCLCLDVPVCFSNKIVSLGEYYYVDANHVKQTASFYYYESSDFSATLLGHLVFALVYIFSVFFTLIVGVTLSVVSVLQYKAYLKKRRVEAAEIQARIHRQLQFHSSVDATPNEGKAKILERKKKSERKIEANLFWMALALSTISILSRIIFTITYLLFSFNFYFSNYLSVITLCFMCFTLMPSTSIVVFYSFNDMFRQKLRRLLGIGKHVSPSSSSNQHTT